MTLHRITYSVSNIAEHHAKCVKHYYKTQSNQNKVVFSHNQPYLPPSPLNDREAQKREKIAKDTRLMSLSHVPVNVQKKTTSLQPLLQAYLFRTLLKYEASTNKIESHGLPFGFLKQWGYKTVTGIHIGILP